MTTRSKRLCFTALAVFACTAPWAQTTESMSTTNDIGFATVAAARQALQARPDTATRITQPDGWAIVTDPGPPFSLWSFTPPQHPAHPAAVRRVIVQSPSGAVHVEMSILCQAATPPCDQLYAQFGAINGQLREGVRSRLK